MLWSADDLRERLAFGLEGGGPPSSSVREALRALEGAGRVERVEVWGRVGWGGTRHAYRLASADAEQRACGSSPERHRTDGPSGAIVDVPRGDEERRRREVGDEPTFSCAGAPAEEVIR